MDFALKQLTKLINQNICLVNEQRLIYWERTEQRKPSQSFTSVAETSGLGDRVGANLTAGITASEAHISASYIVCCLGYFDITQSLQKMPPALIIRGWKHLSGSSI